MLPAALSHPMPIICRKNVLELNNKRRTTLLTTETSTDMAGGADRLVPYKCSQSFIRWFQRAVQPGGWSDGSIVFEDLVFQDVGHEMSPEMASKASQFLQESMDVILQETHDRTHKL